MRPTRHLKLSDSELILLNEAQEQHKNSVVRKRSQAITLNARGYSIAALSKLYSTRQHTIISWLDRWELMGFDGLSISKGRGCKSAFANIKPEQIEIIKTEVRAEPLNLQSVCCTLSQKIGLNISKEVLIKFLKKNSGTHSEEFVNH
jgi:transposase